MSLTKVRTPGSDVLIYVTQRSTGRPEERAGYGSLDAATSRKAREDMGNLISKGLGLKSFGRMSSAKERVKPGV